VRVRSQAAVRTSEDYFVEIERTRKRLDKKLERRGLEEVQCFTAPCAKDTLASVVAGDCHVTDYQRYQSRVT
jgi:hypothetical protein